jgi:DNA-binding GntR family transcriptional regulator
MESLAPPSQRHHALTWLRSEIVSGRIPAGERLIEADLAEQLGMSRAPVREALRQLEQEGLVASRPYAGSEVIGVTQSEVEEVLVPLRLTIERFAFKAALPKLSDGDLETLASLVEAMRTAGAEGDADALAEADVQFHELVIERSDQPHCLQIWRILEPRIRAHFRRDAPAHQTPDEVAEQHERLLTALRDRDESATAEEIERHILDYLPPLPTESLSIVDHCGNLAIESHSSSEEAVDDRDRA